MMPMETTEGKRPLNLLPVALLLYVLLWIIATSGGRHIFVKEILGDAYHSQTEHFSRGDVGVDVSAIQHEVLIVGGKARMYFGPFPAFLRIPLNYIYPTGRGYSSRTSAFCAGLIALVAFGGLIRIALRSSQLSLGWRNALGNTCLIGFAFGSPLLLLVANPSLYHEAIIWGLACRWPLCILLCNLAKWKGRR